MILGNGMNGLSQNVGKKLPFYTAYNPERAQIQTVILIHCRMHCYSTIRKLLFAFKISFNCHSINISFLTVYPLEKWIPSDMSRGSKCGWSNTVYLKHAALLLQLTCTVTQAANCRTGTYLTL
jgi:hypothetical protein